MASVGGMTKGVYKFSGTSRAITAIRALEQAGYQARLAATKPVLSVVVDAWDAGADAVVHKHSPGVDCERIDG